TAFQHPRRMRWRETWLYMERAGLDGIPIVSLISFLMGLITAFQAAIQLTQFGADIYVANLVGLSIVRELGPLMTAIIAAVCSGLIKSVAFAILIAGVGCLRGFQARGGAESVGRITTSAIVAGIFLIIVTDAIFTVLFHYW